MSTATMSAGTTGYEEAKFDVRVLPMDKIRPPRHALRDVKRNSEQYMRMRDAIASAGGPYQSILVREIEDPLNKGEIAYGVIDGLQRFSCCQDLQFENIPARVVDMDEAEIAVAQIIANTAKIETRPVEFTEQLRRMFNADPTLTLELMAEKLHMTPKWVKDRLSLSKLHPDLGLLVDEGKIPLSHAYALAKLQPIDEQLEFTEQAQTQTIQEFGGQITQRKEAIAKANRSGQSVKKEWEPTPHIRSMKELKGQLDSPSMASIICKEFKASTPEEGFVAGLKYVFSLNPSTVEILRQKDADLKKQKDAEKAELRAEKLRKDLRNAEKVAKGEPIDVEDDDQEEDEDE